MAMLAAGLGLLIVAGAVMLAQRRFGLGAGARPLRSVRLGPAHAVHEVEVRGKVFVIGTGPGQAPTLLSEVDGG